MPIIKKVILTANDLPGVNPDGKYLFRYRIVSKNGNYTSEWSPKYNIALGGGFTVNTKGAIVANSSSSDVIVRWDTSLLLSTVGYSMFDVYAGWSTDGGSTYTTMSYVGTTNSNNYYFSIPTPYTSGNFIKVAVQLATYDKTYDSSTTNSSIKFFENTATIA